MTFRRIIPTLLCTIILLTFSFCKKSSDGCNKEIAYQALSDSVLMINPYPTDDVLVFRRNEDDSIQINFDNRFKYTRRSYPGFTIIKGCPPDYKTVEADKTNFTYGSNSFSVELDATDYIFLHFNLNGNNTHVFFAGIYKCHNDTVYTVANQHQDSIVSYYPEIILGGKTHKRVYEFYPIYEYQVEEYWNTTVYYSIEDGLVGFKNLYGLWYLE